MMSLLLKQRCFHTHLFVLVLLFLSAEACFAARGGNGGGKPGGDPPPAVVNYAFQQIPMPGDYSAGIPWPRNINTQGEFAGYYSADDGRRQAYYFDVNSGSSQLTNLNDLTFDPNHSVPNGWYLYAATDINNNGEIAGALARTDDPEVLRGFVLELRPDSGSLPRLHLTPDDAWTHTYASRINDAGEVLGRGNATESYVYQAPVHGAIADTEVDLLPMEFDAFYAHLNNSSGSSPAQVLTNDGKLFTLGNAAATDLGLVARIDAFNDAGTISGSRPVSGKGKRTNEVAYTYDGQFNDIDGLRIAVDLNESNDVVGPAGSSRPTLVHATHGIVDLDLAGIVEFGSELERNLWDSVKKSPLLVSERGIVGTDPSVDDFPLIVGTIDNPDGPAFAENLFILRPIPVTTASIAAVGVPEPTAALLALIAITPITWMRRSRRRG